MATNVGLGTSVGTSVVQIAGAGAQTIAKLQRALGVEPDGVLGPATRQALRRAQAERGLEPTGELDERTLLTLLDTADATAPGLATTAFPIVEDAHQAAVTRPLDAIVGELQKVLGQRVVAYAIGDKHPKTVGRYARGERTKLDPTTERRLIDMYVAYRVLVGPLKPRSARSWMIGSNPLLGTSPIEMIHEGRTAEVIGAAETFVRAR